VIYIGYLLAQLVAPFETPHVLLDTGQSDTLDTRCCLSHICPTETEERPKPQARMVPGAPRTDGATCAKRSILRFSRS